MQIMSNFNSSMKEFLDSRQKWASIDDLKANTDVLMPIGFQAYCEADSRWYVLASATNEKDPSTYVWEKLTHDVNEVYTKSETDTLVANKIAEIVADAPEDFDTLKEMSDWISSHENSAAAMNSAIQTNSTDISSLKKDSHTHSNKTVLDGITQSLLDKIGTNESNITTKMNKKAACVDGANYNDFTETGFYEVLGNNTNPSQNSPDGNNTNNNFYLIVQKRASSYFSQTAFSVRSDGYIYHRVCANSVFTEWKRIANETDIAKINTDIDINKDNILVLIDNINGTYPNSDFIEDTESLMTKHVPTGMRNYAAISKIGGKARQTVNISNVPSSCTISSTTGNIFELTDCKLISGKTYTMTGTFSTAVSADLIDENSVKHISLSSVSSINVTFTAKANCSKVRLYVDGTTTLTNFMIQEGSTATPYEPYGKLWYAPVNSIVSVGINQADMVSGVSINANTGVEVSSSNYSSSNPIKLDWDNNTVYRFLRDTTTGINSFISYYDANMMYMGRTNAHAGEMSFKKTDAITVQGTQVVDSTKKYSDVAYIRICYYSSDWESANICFSPLTTYTPLNKNVITIPEEIQNLPGWGFGFNGLSNTVDFDKAQYTQQIGDFKNTLTFSYVTSGSGLVPYFMATIPTGAMGTVGAFNTDPQNLLCGEYTTVARNSTDFTDKCIVADGASSAITQIQIKDSAFTTAEAFNSHMANKSILYQLSSPITTDISSIVPPISIEAGGTITLQNTNNFDVPNTVLYKQEVLFNA